MLGHSQLVVSLWPLGPIRAVRLNIWAMQLIHSKQSRPCRHAPHFSSLSRLGSESQIWHLRSPTRTAGQQLDWCMATRNNVSAFLQSIWAMDGRFGNIWSWINVYCIMFKASSASKGIQWKNAPLFFKCTGEPSFIVLTVHARICRVQVSLYPLMQRRWKAGLSSLTACPRPSPKVSRSHVLTGHGVIRCELNAWQIITNRI